MRYFLYSFGLFIFLGLISCGGKDPVLMTHEVPKYGVIKLRAFKDWEASVSVYLEFHKRDGKKLVSGPFYYAPPDVFKGQPLNLRISTYDDVVYIRDTTNNDIVLSMISISKNLVYPPDNIESKQYSAEVDALFEEIKKHLSDNDLKLRW